MKRIATSLWVVWALLSRLHAGDWESLPPLPEPNGGFACGTLNGGIVIAGGTKWVDGVKVWMDKIWWFDPQSLKWTAKGTLPHPLGYGVTGQWHGNVIIAGGSDGTKGCDEGWRLNASFELTLLGHLKNAVAIAQGGVCGDELFVVSGTPDVAKLDALVASAQWIHLPDGSTKAIPLPNGVPFGSGASVVIGGHLYVFGGVRSDPASTIANLANAWTFDAATKQWQALAPYPEPVRGIDGVALDDHRIFLGGGFTDDFSDRSFIFDTKTNTYTGTIRLPIANCAKFIECAGQLYMLGGEPAKKVRTDKCWRIPLDKLRH